MKEVKQTKLSKRPTRPAFGWANLVLITLIIGINAYVLLMPLWPQVALWVREKQASATSGLPYETHVPNAKPAAKRQVIPSDNRLVIPRIAVNDHVFEGTDPHLLNQGIWARPNTSTPPAGGNTVLAGHRFSYAGNPSLYSLDKVKVGDYIVIYWGRKEYDYQVVETKEVAAIALEIENPTTDPQLTLYTCTPLWHPVNRLVVIAKLAIGPKSYE